MTTVGLAMIVKNEAHVIERSLSSVRHLVDHWLIVDTGSQDGTPELVQDLMSGVPGALYHRPWVNFGHNRTEALQAARVATDYTLVLDADDVLETPPGFAWPDLDADLVRIAHRLDNLTSRRPTLLSTRLAWHYQGVRNENLYAPGKLTATFLPDALVRVNLDGGRTLGRTREQVRAEDAAALAAAIEEQPGQAGLHYHLACALRDSNQTQAAMNAFRQRARMGGNPEEVAESMFEVARLLQRSGAHRDTVIAAYLDAWDIRPQRAEALVALAAYARENDRYSIARMAASRAREIPRPDDVLWIDEEAYSWRADDEYAVSAFWTGAYAETARVCRALLAGDALPDAHRDRVESNLNHAEQRLAPPVAQPAPVEEPVEEPVEAVAEEVAEAPSEAEPLESVAAEAEAASQTEAQLPRPRGDEPEDSVTLVTDRPALRDLEDRPLAAARSEAKGAPRPLSKSTVVIPTRILSRPAARTSSNQDTDSRD